MKKLIVLLSLLLIFVLWGCGLIDEALKDEEANENPPSSPSALVVNLTQYNTIRLVWQDNSLIEDGFIIEVKIDNASWEEVGEVSRNRSSYTYDDVFENHTYIFRVKAYNDAGESDWTTGSMIDIPIFPPSGLTGYGQNETIVLEWSDNSITENGYKLERRLATEDTWENPVTVDENGETYTDETVEPDVEYEYRIRAFIGSDYSEYSNSTTVSTASIAVDVNAPSNLLADPAETQIDLSWTDNSDNEDGFVIERMTQTETWVVIETTEENVALYEDLDIVSDVEYSYRIMAIAGSSNSTYSNISSAIINSIPTELEAPSNLHGDAYETGVDLFWDDNSATELGFYVQRSQGSAGWATIATLDPNTITYVDEEIESLVGYNYRVQAFGTDETVSVYSNTVLLVIPFYVPENMNAVYVEVQELVRVSWTDNSDVETGFQILARTNGGNWFSWRELDANVVTTTDNDLTPGDTYEYKIRAINDIAATGYSNTAIVTIPSSGSSETIYSSSFEDDTVGDFPQSDGFWGYSLAGINASVSDENAATGSKSIKFIDPDPGANGYLIKEFTGNGYATAEVNFKIYFEDTHGTLAITVHGDSEMASFLQFEENGDMFVIDNGNNDIISNNYEVNHWFDVSLRYSVTNHTFDVWIDGQNVADNIPMSTSSTPLRRIKFNLWGDRVLPDGAFVDDVEIIYFYN